MSALYKLEEAGIPVVTSLARNLPQFIKVSGVILDEGCPEETAEGVEEVIQLLALGLTEPPRPLVWRVLYEMLRELGLEDINQQIEDYLTSELLQLLCEEMEQQRLNAPMYNLAIPNEMVSKTHKWVGLLAPKFAPTSYYLKPKVRSTLQMFHLCSYVEQRNTT